MKKPVLFWLIVIIIFVADQLTKFFARLFLHDTIQIIPNFLDIALVQNTGAGFGLFQGQVIFLIIVSVAVAAFILYYYKKIIQEKWIAVFVALLLGGTLGNLVDRFVFGYVTDFIAFTFWPAFNIADSALTVGSIGLIGYILIKKN